MPAKKLTKAQVNAEARAIVKDLVKSTPRFLTVQTEMAWAASSLREFQRRARRLRPYLKEDK